MISLSFHYHSNNSHFEDELIKTIELYRNEIINYIHGKNQNGGSNNESKKSNKKNNEFKSLIKQWRNIIEIVDRNRGKNLIKSIEKETKGKNIFINKIHRTNKKDKDIYINFSQSDAIENSKHFKENTDKINFQKKIKNQTFHLSLHWGDSGDSVNLSRKLEIPIGNNIGLLHITHNFRNKNNKSERVWEKTFPLFIIRDYKRNSLKIDFIQSLKKQDREYDFSEKLFNHFKYNIVPLIVKGINSYLRTIHLIKIETIKSKPSKSQRTRTTELLPLLQNSTQKTSLFHLLSDENNGINIEENNNDRNNNKDTVVKQPQVKSKTKTRTRTRTRKNKNKNKKAQTRKR